MKTVVRPSVIAIAALAVLGSNARADDATGMSLIPSVSAVKWDSAPATLPKGTQIALLNGDPAKPGPFVLRLKFPAHTVVAPHRHATAENLTVITGDFYHEMGDKVDPSRGDKLTAGGFVYLPGMLSHSVWTAGSEAIVQVTGTGPFGLLYVNPADDPGKTAK